MSDRDTMQNEAMHARRQFERELEAQDKRRAEKRPDKEADHD